MKNEIFSVISFCDFSSFYKFGKFLKAKSFLYIGNERRDTGICPILKIPRSNSRPEQYCKLLLLILNRLIKLVCFFCFLLCIFAIKNPSLLRHISMDAQADLDLLI